MKKMLSSLRELGYKGVSLSVQKENYACSMYKKLGFKTIQEKDEEYIMVNVFSQSSESAPKGQ